MDQSSSLADTGELWEGIPSFRSDSNRTVDSAYASLQHRSLKGYQCLPFFNPSGFPVRSKNTDGEQRTLIPVYRNAQPHSPKDYRHLPFCTPSGFPARSKNPDGEQSTLLPANYLQDAFPNVNGVGESFKHRQSRDDGPNNDILINEPTITNLAQDIIRTIPEILTATERSFANLCGTLPKLIKDFAISFNCYKELAASDEAAIFLANNAGVITSKLKKLRSQMNPSKSCTPTASNNQHSDVGFDTSESQWFDDNNTEKDAQNALITSSHLAIIENPAYFWFNSRILRNLTVSALCSGPYNPVYFSISFHNSFGNARTCSARYVVDWDPVKFIEEQYPEKHRMRAGNFTGLGEILTITGTLPNTQVLTVKEYIQQTWPVTGTEVLNAVEDAIRLRYDSSHIVRRRELSNGATLWPTGPETDAANTRQCSSLVINARGPTHAVTEIGWQLSWMGAAIRVTKTGAGVAYCEPTVTVNSTDIFIRFSTTFLTTLTISNGLCWQALFRDAVIAQSFPIRDRSVSSSGMEVSLNILAALMRARRVQEFAGKLFIKAFNALLVLTKRTSDVMIWHLVYNQNGEHISYNDHRLHQFISEAPLNVLTNLVQSTRHIVGWCPRVSCLAGSPEIGNEIGRSWISYIQQGCMLEKVAITGGQFITAGASFVLGKKDSPVYLRPRDDYFEQIVWMSKKFVIFYDSEDRRAWMVDGASALLHLVRASLRHNQDDDLCHLFLFQPDNLVEALPSVSGKRAAIAVLSNQENLDVKLRLKAVETSEEETTRRDGTVEVVTKKKKTYYTFKDRVDHICHFLEQMMAYQSQALSQDGVEFKIRGTARRKIEGFEFQDIVEGRDPLLPRVATLQSAGVGWVDLAHSLGAITLFGRGFGEMFKPSSDGVQICAHWSSVPKGFDYLTASVSDLLEILKSKGCARTNDDTTDCQLTQDNPNRRHWKLVGDIYWLNPGTLFDACTSSGKCIGQKCYERVQVLLPTSVPRLWAKFNSPLIQELRDAADGAVIFAHNRKLSLWRPSPSDREHESLEESASATSNENLSVPSTDSGIGSSIESTQSGSQHSPGSQPPDQPPTTQEKKRRNPFSRSRKKSKSKRSKA